MTAAKNAEITCMALYEGIRQTVDQASGAINSHVESDERLRLLNQVEEGARLMTLGNRMVQNACDEAGSLAAHLDIERQEARNA